METKTILQQFKEKVCEKIYLEERGVNKFNVITPFMFEDNDLLVIILKHDLVSKKWYLTDEGHTYFHISYFVDEKDMFSGTRKEIIESAISMHELIDKDGELVKEIADNQFGNALYDFIQGLLKIADITYLDRERVKSTFFEDFKGSIEHISKKRKLVVKFNHYAEFDKNKSYPVDCVVETKKIPIYLFAIHSDNKCKDALISIYEFERKKMRFHPLAVFENQENIRRSVLSRFSAVCDKQIPNLEKMHEFEKYLESYELN